MTKEEKERIEKEAISYVINETGYQVLPEHDHWKSAYTAGATSENERLTAEIERLKKELQEKNEYIDMLNELERRGY